MPMYNKNFQTIAVAENLGWRGINLPSFPGLTEAQVQFICKTIQSYKPCM
jgi:perosamine synthetase